LTSDFLISPYDVSDFIEIFTQVCDKFILKVQEKFYDLTRGMFSGTLLRNTEGFALLKSEAQYEESKSSEDFALGKNGAELLRLISGMKESLKIDESELIWEQSHWTLLCALEESLNSVHAEVQSMLQPIVTRNPSSPREVKDKEVEVDNSRSLVQLMNESMLGLAEKILFFLKLEFSCHCIHFLSQISSSSYYLDSEISKPEKFVAELVKVYSFPILS
jgi:hypothetical protein